MNTPGDISAYLVENAHLINSRRDKDTVDPTTVAAREVFIQQSRKLLARLEEAAENLATEINRATRTHVHEVGLINAALQTLKPGTQVTVDRTRAAYKTAQASDGRRRVKFTEALHVTPVVVSSFDHVCADGRLYYVEPAGHFAFKIDDYMFHGNIGTIHTDNKSLTKLRDCKYGVDCPRGNACEYYHDPCHFPGSTDVRNYTPVSWTYAPVDAPPVMRARGRKFGSRTNLDTDIMTVNPAETSKYCDQAMHDVLCGMLLMKYNRSTG